MKVRFLLFYYLNIYIILYIIFNSYYKICVFVLINLSIMGSVLLFSSGNGGVALFENLGKSLHELVCLNEFPGEIRVME